MRIVGQKFSGRDVYNYFLTEKEFKLISPCVCPDGRREELDWCLKEGESLSILLSAIVNVSDEFLERIEGRRFVVGGELRMQDKLKELNIPEIEIKFWHRLGCSF